MSGQVWTAQCPPLLSGLPRHHPCYLQAVLDPQIALREVAVNPSETALLFVDCQRWCCVKTGRHFKDEADVRGQASRRGCCTSVHVGARAVPDTLQLALMPSSKMTDYTQGAGAGPKA